jgi:hypothetical protein
VPRLAPLALALLSAEPRIAVEGESVDAGAVTAGLVARVRAGTADDWAVDVVPTSLRGQYTLRLRPPAGAPFERTVVLEGDTVEARSRELSAALSVIVEGWTPPPSGDASAVQVDGGSADTPRRRTIGQVLLAARVGAPQPLDAGVAAAGGLEVLRGHLVPRLDVAWSRSGAGELTLDGVRFGAGLLAGAPVHRVVWLGVGATPRALWASAHDRGRAQTWAFTVEVAGVLQARAGRFFFAELRAGADLTTTRLRARGTDATLEWGHARFVGVFGVGARI